MCKQCTNIQDYKKPKISIWNIPDYQLCTVIGTCIETSQLRKLKNKFVRYVKNYPLKTDYDIHACSVSICQSNNALSKWIQKLITQNHSQFIHDASSLKTDRELLELWESRNHTDMKQLAGYYWAILISPHASDALKDRIYGEVHMISHISSRNRINQHDNSKQHKNLKMEIDKKDRKLKEKNAELTAIKAAQLKMEEQILKLTKVNNDLDTSLREKAESPVKLKQIISSQMKSMDWLQTKVEKQQNEIADLNNLLNREKCDHKNQPAIRNETDNIVSLHPEKERTEAKQHNDLCGKKILYVGGFSRHRDIFQKLTENINGSFLYHDGGTQQSVNQLENLVKRADAIFCPIDCISHNAMDHIKALSRNECKDCVFLRSASVSSYKNNVLKYASESH